MLMVRSDLFLKYICFSTKICMLVLTTGLHRCYLSPNFQFPPISVVQELGLFSSRLNLNIKLKKLSPLHLVLQKSITLAFIFCVCIECAEDSLFCFACMLLSSRIVLTSRKGMEHYHWDSSCLDIVLKIRKQSTIYFFLSL